MRANAAFSTFEYVDMPLRDQQLAALNAALTAEVLRHAETRQKLLTALTWCWLKNRPAPVEVVRKVPVVVPAPAEPEPAERPHWTPGASRQRTMVKFPMDVDERTGLAAVIRQPLRLRSGALLDPVYVTVRRGGKIGVFPDSSWLVLCVLAQQPGVFVPTSEVRFAVFERDQFSAARSAIHRARLTLGSVGAKADLESTRIGQSSAWRLMLAEE